MSSTFRPSGASWQQQAQQPKPEIDLIDWAVLDGLEPPARRWVVDRLIPCQQVSGVWGAGGTGKSTLVQQMATTAILAREFLGMSTNAQPVLYITTEEDHDESWRRQLDICRHLGISLGDLDGKLHIAARAGLDNAVAQLDQLTDLPALTPLMQSIEDKAKDVGATTLVLDNLTQVFACEDHKRHVVTAFINQMRGVAHRLGEDGAVLLVGHISKARESEFSGSQAWNDGVRSRLLLTRDEKDPAVLSLKTSKANYSGQQAFALTWANGVLQSLDPTLMSHGERAAMGARKLDIDQRFLDALDRLTARGLTVSHKPGTNYAVRAMVDYAADITGDATADELKAAVGRLLSSGVIKHGECPVRC